MSSTSSSSLIWLVDHCFHFCSNWWWQTAATFIRVKYISNETSPELSKTEMPVDETSIDAEQTPDDKKKNGLSIGDYLEPVKWQGLLLLDSPCLDQALFPLSRKQLHIPYCQYTLQIFLNDTLGKFKSKPATLAIHHRYEETCQRFEKVAGEACQRRRWRNMPKARKSCWRGTPKTRESCWRGMPKEK